MYAIRSYYEKLFLLLVLGLPTVLFAQRFEGGLLAGINASQIDGDFTGTYNKAGLVGGAFVATKFQNNWGGQLEIRYAAKGSTVKLDSLTSRKIRLQYIELPILATFDPYKMVQFHGGVSLGYLFSAAQNDGSLGYIEFQQFDPYEVALCIRITSYNVCYTKLLRSLCIH